MYHTSGFQLVTVLGYLCKLQYVYILTHCPKPTNPNNFLQSIIFLNTSQWITCNLPNSQLYKDTKLLFDTLSGPEAEPASYLVGTAGFFPGVQQPHHLAVYSPPSSANIFV